MKELLMKLIAEGKSNKEIAQAIAGHEDAKGMDVDAVVKAIEEARKSSELEAKLDAKDAEKAAKAEKDAQVKEMKEEILKSINVNPVQNFAPVKRFDLTQGKEVEISNHEQKALQATNDLLKAMANGDRASANSISKEIHADNQVYGRKDARSDADANGGYAVPTLVYDKIMQLAYAKSVMLENANKIVVPTESMVIPTMGAVSAAYIANQETAASEQNATFTGPSIDMKRVGLFTNIANTFVGQRGDIVSEFVNAYGSAAARFLDLHMAVGSVDGNSDALDGIVFQALTNLETPIALSDLGLDDLITMLETISDEADKDSLRFICNRKVYHDIAGTRTLAGTGDYVFPQFLAGGEVAPLGVKMVVNSKIPSTLDVGGDARTGGTDDVLILADMSKFTVGIGGNMKIDTSEHFNFTTDQLTIRGIQRVGWASVLAACEVLELTN